MRLGDGMTRPERRIYCWIRQQRYLLAVHKFIYYVLSDHILEDLQFDYLEKRLNVVENRYQNVSDAVTKEGYLSPSSYVDALLHPSIESRARRMVDRWESGGRPRIDNVPFMNADISNFTLYRDALRAIVRYPI